MELVPTNRDSFHLFIFLVGLLFLALAFFLSVPACASGVLYVILG